MFKNRRQAKKALIVFTPMHCTLSPTLIYCIWAVSLVGAQEQQLWCHPTGSVWDGGPGTFQLVWNEMQLIVNTRFERFAPWKPTSDPWRGIIPWQTEPSYVRRSTERSSITQLRCQLRCPMANRVLFCLSFSNSGALWGLLARISFTQAFCKCHSALGLLQAGSAIPGAAHQL